MVDHHKDHQVYHHLYHPVQGLIIQDSYHHFHTIHHHIPGLHWSKTREAHDQIAQRIDPTLNEWSFWWLIVRVYILGVAIPRFRSISMRMERMNNISFPTANT